MRRLAGIVLEKLGRSLNSYDPDEPALHGLDTDWLLARLECAVAHLHSIGLAHNDIKPSNVTLRADHQPVLIDSESCAPLGEATPCQGTDGRYESPNMASRVENDLYALRRMRERLGIKEGVEKWFRNGSGHACLTFSFLFLLACKRHDAAVSLVPMSPATCPPFSRPICAIVEVTERLTGNG